MKQLIGIFILRLGLWLRCPGAVRWKRLQLLPRQSHERYEILTQALADYPTMTMEEVRDVMDSVSKDNFNEFESTEWTAVFDLSAGEAHYYHRENYENRYTFSIG